MKPASSSATETLAAALHSALRKRGGKLYGRLGWLGLVLQEEQAYVCGGLSSNREAFVAMFIGRVDELRQLGFAITVKEYTDAAGLFVDVRLPGVDASKVARQLKRDRLFASERSEISPPRLSMAERRRYKPTESD